MKNITRYKKYLHELNRGFIALTSILIISIVTFAIAISISLLGIQEAATSLGFKKGSETLKIAESCMEEGLLRIKNSSSYKGTTLNMDKGSCTINIGGTDPNFSIVIYSTMSGQPSFHKKVEANIKKSGDSISVMDWRETN